MMKKTCLSLVATEFVLLGIVLAPASTSAQPVQPPATAPTVDMSAPAPRLPNGKPDFSGSWTATYTPDTTRSATLPSGVSHKGESNPLPLTTWGQAQWDNENPTKFGDYAGSCNPFGWSRMMNLNGPLEIQQTDKKIAFLWELATMYQLVDTTGRPHRGLPPSWFGDARGHWEGDTLVIDVTNLNGYTKIDTIGHPMSDQSHLIMTLSRPDMGHIHYTFIDEDPKTYTRPIRAEKVLVLDPNMENIEYACMEGNMKGILEGAITPWVGHKEVDENLAPVKWQWPAFDLTKSQKYTGVIKELKWENPLVTAKIDIEGKMFDVAIAPLTRLNFRAKGQDQFKPGTTITFQAVPSRQNPSQLRAELLMDGRTPTDMR
jgi:hypothetical protein